MADPGVERGPHILTFLSYPPILRGLILLIISGAAFPLSGVFILRMNLLPIRFLMMHGVLLGGALGLGLGLNLSFTSLAVNLVLIILLNRSSRILKSDYGFLSMFFMVSSVALASLVMSYFQVPAKDTLVLLWGSLYASDTSSIIVSAAVALALMLFSICFFRQLTAIFHDKDVAVSLGLRIGVFEFVIMILIALVVASAMRLMGALLLDALILLPVIIASLVSKGLKQMMLLSSLFGLIFSVCGFFLSLQFDIPVSAGLTLPACGVFFILILMKRGRMYER